MMMSSVEWSRYGQAICLKCRDLLTYVSHSKEPVELAQEFRKFDLAAPWEQFPAFREMIPAAEEIPIDEKK